MDGASPLTIATEILFREASYLDEQRWPEWAALFHPQCEYWVPSWRDDGTLVEDPKREISLFYHSNRAGLEDRIFRITSGQSPASVPVPRTAHIVSNIHLAGSETRERIDVRSTWVSYVYDPKHGESHQFFGRSEHALTQENGAWLILRKKAVMLNDRIGSTLDIYCI